MAKLSAASRIALGIGSAEASALQAGDLDSEHLLLGLFKIEDILARGTEVASGITESEWEEACDEVRDFRDTLLRAGINPKAARRTLRKILRAAGTKRERFLGRRTARCCEVLEAAERMCPDPLSPLRLASFFMAALEQPSPLLERLFSELGLQKRGVMRRFSEASSHRSGIPLSWSAPNPRMGHGLNGATGGASVDDGPTTPLIDKLGRDLTRLARDGKIEPVIGRANEIRKIARALIQKHKNAPLLIGDAGVGKTKIVEGLALKIASPNAPTQIRDLRIIEITPSAMVAGTRYRGDFEERMEQILKEASSDPHIILFIDEIHALIDAGHDEMNAANILKPVLSRGALKCIGATTTEEYRRHIENDDALARRFQVIHVDEPTHEETVLILQGIRPRFEAHYGLCIPDPVIEKTVELAVRYLPDLRLPDKAIDIIDQSCSRSVLKTVTGTPFVEETRTINVEDVAAVVSEKCRVPAEDLTIDERERLLQMEEHLRRRVMGQDHAIAEVAETLRAARVGIKDPRRPTGVFLFLGMTGTGKTELAKALANFLFHDEDRLIALDMSEYQEEHSVSRLVGSPPGYIGYGDEGQLTGKIRTNPYSVVLLDEIEKAHPNVFDLFLQVFEEGRLTDSKGRRADFSESIIILTSNLGSEPAAEKVGFFSGDGNSDDENPEHRKKYDASITRALAGAFRPEFLNRIQKKIVFYPLGKPALRKIIIEKILGRLNDQLKPRSMKATLDESAVEFLLRKGDYDLYGARELQRIFDQYAAEPLSAMILAGEILPGQTVTISANSGHPSLKIFPA